MASHYALCRVGDSFYCRCQRGIFAVAAALCAPRHFAARCTPQIYRPAEQQMIALASHSMAVMLALAHPSWKPAVLTENTRQRRASLALPLHALSTCRLGRHQHALPVGQEARIFHACFLLPAPPSGHLIASHHRACAAGASAMTFNSSIRRSSRGHRLRGTLMVMCRFRRCAAAGRALLVNIIGQQICCRRRHAVSY